jgi:ATP-binding protein involved in chromosome partitioning
MSINIDFIKDELGKLIDPELKVSLSSSNSIANIEISDKSINAEINLVGPINWVAPAVQALAVDMLRAIAPGYTYTVKIGELPYHDDNKQVLKKVKNIIAVASGKGGVGKSAMAANIAAGLSLSGAKVGILDGDVYGPSIPTMFGMKNQPIEAVQNEDGTVSAYPNEKYGIKMASMGFIMNRDEAAIVRGPMLAGYFTMLFEQIDWGELDFLVFDLPPGTGDIQLTLTQKIPLTGAVIVTTPQEIALADVRRSISMFRRVNVEILGVIENMSYFVPDDMPDKKYYIFGEGGGKAIADENQIELLGEVPINIDFRFTNDSGKPLMLHEKTGAQGEVLKSIVAATVRRVREVNHSKLSETALSISL